MYVHMVACGAMCTLWPVMRAGFNFIVATYGLPALSLSVICYLGKAPHKCCSQGLRQNVCSFLFLFCCISYFCFLFLHTHLLSSFWLRRGHRCRPFSPPVLAFNFYRARGSAIPLLVECSYSVDNSRPCALRKSIFVQEKCPRI